MPNLLTNSDLYRAVAALGATTPARTRPLEEYLRALWSSGYDHCDSAVMGADAFVHMLSAALEAPAPPFDPAWAREDLSLDEGADPFTVWARTLRTQICDLRELTAAGLYRNRTRYLGVDAPRPPGTGPRSVSARWYNVDIASYLESGVEGAFGGWRPEFEDAVVDTAPARPAPMSSVSWTDLTRFAISGQQFE